MAAPIEPLKGEELFRATPAKVFLTLTDLDAFAQTIPDLQSSTRVDEKTMQCVVRPGFSFIRGTMKAVIQITESTPNESVVMLVKASGIGMGMEVQSKLRISPEEGGAASRLVWETAVLGRSGLLSLVSPTLIQGAAEKTIRDGWETLRKRVEG